MIRLFLVLYICLSTDEIFAMGPPNFINGDCTSIGATPTDGLSVIPGPEDLALANFRNTQRIIVSSHDRNNSESEGAFFVIDPESGRHEKMEVDWGDQSRARNLRPHGIDVLNQDEGHTYLYAINHPPPDEQDGFGHEVLVFKINKSKLEFIEEKSISHELFVSPNDLTVLSNGDLFVTNLKDHSPVWGWFKMLIGMKYGNVVYVNSTSKSVDIVFEASMPNGVLADQETGKLLVTTSRGNTFYVLDYNPLTGEVNKKPIITFPITSGDNITKIPGAKKKVLVASHPKPFRFLRHKNNIKKDSPSLILSVKYLEGSDPNIFFSDDGSRLSAASTGLVYDGYLYIGQVYRSGVYRCRLR